VGEDAGAVAAAERHRGEVAGVVSPATRLDVAEKNATTLPSPLMAGSVLASLAWPPGLSRLTRSVVPACRFQTNTSGQLPGR